VVHKHKKTVLQKVSFVIKKLETFGKTVCTIEMKLKHNRNENSFKTVSKQFFFCYVSTKTKRPAVERLSCFSQSLSLFAVLRTKPEVGRAKQWRERDVIVVTAG